MEDLNSLPFVYLARKRGANRYEKRVLGLRKQPEVKGGKFWQAETKIPAVLGVRDHRVLGDNNDKGVVGCTNRLERSKRYLSELPMFCQGCPLSRTEVVLEIVRIEAECPGSGQVKKNLVKSDPLLKDAFCFVITSTGISRVSFLLNR